LYGGYASWALHAITGKAANNYTFSSANLASEWNAGDLIVLSSDSTTSNPYIVPTHAYAVVGFNGSTFTLLNPWGTNSAGTAPGLYNNHYVYGQFSASAATLGQNFGTTSLGTGAMPVNHVAAIAFTSGLFPRFDGSIPSPPAPVNHLEGASQEDFHALPSSEWQMTPHTLVAIDEAFVDMDKLILGL
jgi:hypothetical protein